jgi:GTPase SAR1 family protein
LERVPSLHGYPPYFRSHLLSCTNSSLEQYCYDLFPYFYDPGWDRDSKEITINGETHKIELEDLSTYVTPDQPFDLRDRVIQTAEGFVLVYDVTSKASFDSIKAIHSEVRRKGKAKRPVVIVGNKCDDVDEREVITAAGRQLAKQLRCNFAEVSARNGTGLDELFLDLSTEINRLKRKETKLTTNLNCKNLGKALLDVFERLNKGLERMHWKILYWMYGPDRPLRVQPMVRPVSQVVDVYEVPRVNLATSVESPRVLLGGKASKRSLNPVHLERTHVEYESEMMSGGLEITMAEPSGLALPVHRI